MGLPRLLGSGVLSLGAILAGVLFWTYLFVRAVRFRWRASFSSWLARRKTGGLFGREGHSHPGVSVSMRSSDQPRLRAGACIGVCLAVYRRVLGRVCIGL